MRPIHKLTDRKVKTAHEGLHGDGGGLLLQVTKGAAGQLNRSWLFRFELGGRERRMGLGPYPAIGLGAAREQAANAREQLARGIDPLDAKASVRARQPVRPMTFSQCVDGFFKAHQVGWGPRHAALWRRSLEMHVTFGRMPVAAIDSAAVMSCIGPLWAAQPDLAARLRGRIERVLDWARAAGFRDGENPARWGHLKYLLPAHRRVHKTRHFAALPYNAIGEFVRQLRELRGTAPRALEFTILTAARAGEVLGARWDEIGENVWTVPASRMKGRLEHRVPLSPAALAIIKRQALVRENQFVFPGQRRGKLTATVLTKVLARMGRSAITAHGFRSTFKDWASETTDHPNWVSEKALAHLVGDETQRAYQRGDLLEKRRALMNDWAAFIEAPASRRDDEIEIGAVAPIASAIDAEFAAAAE
jgi:integrase